ncbi:hypothetical protein EDB82DRAFT_495568 [Fusarium venenatum]|uniref:uncharacterized protein n=1 Tax=Fusarium venenatum TaxID=56646 RepID=UPI001D8C95FA|nr:hypothetical protein EDB82DRAFT_495568 [Fusarium venenatum]
MRDKWICSVGSGLAVWAILSSSNFLSPYLLTSDMLIPHCRCLSTGPIYQIDIPRCPSMLNSSSSSVHWKHYFKEQKSL